MTQQQDPYTPDGRLAKMALGNAWSRTRSYQTPGTATLFKLASRVETSMIELEYNVLWTAKKRESDRAHHPSAAIEQDLDAELHLRCVEPFIDGFRDERFQSDIWLRPIRQPVVSSGTSGIATADPHEPTSSLNFSASTNRLSVDNSTTDNAAIRPTTRTTRSATTPKTDGLGSSTSSGSGSFLYDGDGRRVKKVWTSGGTTVNTSYVYDANGNVAAEYSDQTAGSPTTSYVFTDMLGQRARRDEQFGHTDRML